MLSLVSWPLDIKENAFRFHLATVEMKVSWGGVRRVTLLLEAEQRLEYAAPRLCRSGRLDRPGAQAQYGLELEPKGPCAGHAAVLVS